MTHMDEFKAQEAVILQILLSLYYRPQLLTPCACGKASRLRTVACSDCLQGELLCRQCWLDKHRVTPTHWALIWNQQDRFFEKHDFCRVLKNAAVAIGHNGHRCPNADPSRTFTLVDSNGIHATSVTYCRCESVDGPQGEPEFQQLLRAGIFPGSVKEPKTGYTLGVLEYYRQLRSQGKGSAYNFVLVLQRLADPFFAGSVPVTGERNSPVTRLMNTTSGCLRQLPRNNTLSPKTRHCYAMRVRARSRDSSPWRDGSALPQPSDRLSWSAMRGLPRAGG